jgi:hypothetical protein
MIEIDDRAHTESVLPEGISQLIRWAELPPGVTLVEESHHFDIVCTSYYDEHDRDVMWHQNDPLSIGEAVVTCKYFVAGDLKIPSHEEPRVAFSGQVGTLLGIRFGIAGKVFALTFRVDDCHLEEQPPGMPIRTIYTSLMTDAGREAGEQISVPQPRDTRHRLHGLFG